MVVVFCNNEGVWSVNELGTSCGGVCFTGPQMESTATPVGVSSEVSLSWGVG